MTDNPLMLCIAQSEGFCDQEQEPNTFFLAGRVTREIH